jgi:hypothetical protein
MHRTALTLLLALSAFAVQAGVSDAPQAPAQAPAEAGPTAPAAGTETVAAADAKTEVVAKPAHERSCLRDTGTRLKRRDRHGCTSAIGESYTRDDLRSTGGTTTAEALRQLSPRIGG